MKTCVIMGNGPSLLEMPKSAIEQYDTFGVNYCPYSPTYYVCIDHDLLVNHHAEVYSLAAAAKIAFLADKEKGTSPLYDLPDVWLVAKDKEYFAAEHFFSGFTVVYVALKMAFYLGYERVHLWGVDHSPEWNHWREDYPKGDQAHRLQRMQEMEYHYRLAQRVYAVNGRRIVNHSHHSRLDAIFSRK